MSAVYSNMFYSRALPLIKADAGNVVVHLFKNDFSPDNDSVTADFEEADFDGYATVAAAAMLGPVIDEAAKWKIMSVAATFIADSTSDGQTVYGYYATFADDPGLVVSERFATPIGMIPFKSITIQPELVLDRFTGSAEPIV